MRLIDISKLSKKEKIKVLQIIGHSKKGAEELIKSENEFIINEKTYKEIKKKIKNINL